MVGVRWLLLLPYVLFCDDKPSLSTYVLSVRQATRHAINRSARVFPLFPVVICERSVLLQERKKKIRDTMFCTPSADEEAPKVDQEVIPSPTNDPETAVLVLPAVHFLDNNDPPTSSPIVASFQDHFSLHTPSSIVQYRDRQSAARIVEGFDSQFVLEETINEQTKKHQVEIRWIHNTTEGVQLLRFSYVLITAFWTGFLLVFCVQVLLFLALDLAIELGETSNSPTAVKVSKAIGTILAFPVLVYGFSSVLCMAGSYITDAYRGHYLIRTFFTPVTVEWLFFLFFIGFPVFGMCLSLIHGADRWWDITLLVWCTCILVFFVIFCAIVVWYELRACWAIVKRRYHDESGCFLDVLNKCILLRQTSMYGGRKKTISLSYGTIVDTEYTDKHSIRSRSGGDSVTEPEEYISLWANLTMRPKLGMDDGGWGWFQTLGSDEEEKIFTLDEVRDVRPFVTSFNWSLEKVFCRQTNSRYIAIVHGPGALTVQQMRSSLVCSAIGTFLLIFLLFSILRFLGCNAMLGMCVVVIVIAIAITMIFIFSRSSLKSPIRLCRLAYNLELFKRDNEAFNNSSTDNASVCVYLSTEVKRITRPTKRFCYTMLVLELVVFFCLPLASLFIIGNYPVALVFLIVGIITCMRYYINVAIVLEETGNLDLVNEETEEGVWKDQSRLNAIVGNITRGRSRGAWMVFFVLLSVVYIGLFVYGVVGKDEKPPETSNYTYTDAFFYKQDDSLLYPSCRLSDLGDSPLSSMAGECAAHVKSCRSCVQ